MNMMYLSNCILDMLVCTSECILFSVLVREDPLVVVTAEMQARGMRIIDY